MLNRLAAVLVLLASPLVLSAQDAEENRATLRGLTSVDLGLVAGMHLRQLGPEMVQDLGARLKQADIAVQRSSRAALDVSITTLPSEPAGFFAYDVTVALTQLVDVPAVTRRLPVATWSTSRLGVTTESELQREVTVTLQSLVNQFVSAYRSANPRQ